MRTKHGNIQEAITVLDKKAAYKSDKGYYKVIKTPSEKQ